MLHQYTCDASGCETEYVLDIKVLKCRGRVYKRQFERFLEAYSYTNTHGMLMVVTQNMCVVPAWTSIRHSSVIEAL